MLWLRYDVMEGGGALQASGERLNCASDNAPPFYRRFVGSREMRDLLAMGLFFTTFISVDWVAMTREALLALLDVDAFIKKLRSFNFG